MIYSFKEVDKIPDPSQPLSDPARDVDEIAKSVRAMNILETLKIKTIGELCHYTRSDLLRKRNCGIKTVNELENILQEYGLKWADGALNRSGALMTPSEKEFIRQWILDNVTIDVIPPDEGNEEELIKNLLQLLDENDAP